MAVAYIKHALIGLCNGQEIVNILWYYVPAVDLPIPDLAVAFAEAWSGTFAANFVLCLPTSYTLVQSETSVYNVTWEAQLSAAHVLSINEQGQTGGSLMGQSPYAVFNFQLDYTYADVPPSHSPVKRSYIAYGPLQEGAVTDGHAFVPTYYAAGYLDNVKGSITTGMTIPGNEADAVPIRVGSPNFTAPGGPDPNGYRSWAKIIGCTVRNITSDRASRIPS